MTRRAVLLSCAGILLAAAPADAREDEDPPGEDSGTRALTDAESYVRLPVLAAPVPSGARLGARRAMLQVTLALDAPEARTRTLIDERRIWLRDAFNETLLLYGARIYRPGDVPDADLIGELLQGDADRLLGAGQARVVLAAVIVHAG